MSVILLLVLPGFLDPASHDYNNHLSAACQIANRRTDASEIMLSFTYLLALPLLARQAAALYINGSVVAPCDSPIYCYGEMLQQIELAHPFPDSKTFVDL